MSLKKKLKIIFAGAKYLPQSKLRKCRCCDRLSLVVALSSGQERHICIRCRANLRYEMLATLIRSIGSHLEEMTVLELDSRSPLRPLLSKAKTYQRSMYSPNDRLGTIQADGSRCEDITQLTYPDCSLDLIISSDVLEHVPELQAAFRESYRVLRPGGSHIFTVPPNEKTRKRAEIVNNQVRHLVEPEYHSDPLNPEGILAFWDVGSDIATVFSSSGLNFAIASGPEGTDQRIIWKASKPARP
jgi:SAM-dependent methyltransferase